MATRTHTYTFVLMEVSPETYVEIRSKMEEAGYNHAIHEDGTLDMQGIALVRKEVPPHRYVIKRKLGYGYASRENSPDWRDKPLYLRIIGDGPGKCWEVHPATATTFDTREIAEAKAAKLLEADTTDDYEVEVSRGTR